ncbi:MAG: tetratricopeptide repeat protein [Acidobacteriota bacterium]
MGRAKRAGRWVWGAAVLAILLGLAACAPKQPVKPMLTVAELLKDGESSGLNLGNPFELNDAIRLEVEKEVGFGGTPVDRLRRTIRFLNDRGYLNFRYEDNLSLTAVQAFEQKKGDCLSYTNLFMGISRHLKIPAYFVHVSEARNYYEREGIFFVSTHMAVGYGGGAIGLGSSPYTVIVDFTEESSDWRLWLYESIDDATAVALFYNNIAVDRMLGGDIAGAESIVRFLVSKRPGMKELQNNLGVILMRQGRFEEALALLQAAIEKFPTYQPLYTNAVQAARGARRPEVAQSILEMGRKIAQEDPFFLFNEGVNAFHEGDYVLAESRFKAAIKRQSNNPFLFAWLSRVLLASGKEEEGVEAFRKAQEMAPNHRLIRSLRDDYPVLATVRPISPENGSP